MPVKKQTNKRSVKKQNSSASLSLDRLNTFVLRPRNLLLIIGVGILLFLGARYAVNSYQAHVEKQNMLAKQQELEKIADKIAALNKPDERNLNEKCRYQSAKFEKGHLFCSVTVELIYADVDADRANRITSEGSALASSNSVMNESKKKEIIFPDSYDPLIRELSQELDLDGKCYATYTYPFEFENDKNLRIGLFCSEQSSAEYFSVEK